MAYNDYILSLYDIGKKSKCHHSSIDFFNKKTENYHQKKVREL